MKAILLLFFSLFFIISCQEHKETPISATEEENGLQETVDSLSKATAIFWIDKYHMKEMKKDDALSFRTARLKLSFGLMGRLPFSPLWKYSLQMHNDISVTG
jgi:hypothetical protein